MVRHTHTHNQTHLWPCDEGGEYSVVAKRNFGAHYQLPTTTTTKVVLICERRHYVKQRLIERVCKACCLYPKHSGYTRMCLMWLFEQFEFLVLQIWRQLFPASAYNEIGRVLSLSEVDWKHLRQICANINLDKPLAYINRLETLRAYMRMVAKQFS